MIDRIIDRDKFSFKHICIALVINIIFLFICLYAIRAKLQSTTLMLMLAVMLVIDMVTIPFILYPAIKKKKADKC